MPKLWYSSCPTTFGLITLLIFMAEGFIPCTKKLDAATNPNHVFKYPFPRKPQPMCPEIIQTVFMLFNKEIPIGEPISSANSELFINWLKKKKSTKIVIHGWLENAVIKPVMEIRKALIDKLDANVITVDWRNACNSVFDYKQAVVNTWVVGLQLAELLSKLTKGDPKMAAKIHLIGFSLGGHIAGFAGERTPGLGRITGLDPARPSFENRPINQRLDPTDAVFVDVIHTDMSRTPEIPTHGYGIKEPSGHVDFYPNGDLGKISQPGCQFHSIELPLCGHIRAYDYFLESIRSLPNCSFPASLCDTYDKFLESKCKHRNKKYIYTANMGIEAIKYSKKLHLTQWPRKFYLRTDRTTKYSLSKRCAEQ